MTSSGDLYTWGWNSYGQLGDGTTENRLVPVKVGALEDVVQISLGDCHSAAVTSSGDLYTWGLNHRGQLGDGTTTSSSEPAVIDFDRSPLMRLFAQDPGDAVVATDAGTYRCYAAPGPIYKWADGTTSAVEVDWSISKATYDLAGVTFEGAEVACDGAPHSLESQLRAAGIADVSRIAGATRYETAVEVARWAADNGANLSAPVVATGLKDADALAGAALAGRSGSVLLLADDEGTGGEAAPALDFLSEHAAEVHEGYILGGKNAISEALADRILAAANGVMTP